MVNISFAPKWMAEAREATSARHEIVFAACAAESYLFEWVRDQVVLDFRAVTEYFPIDARSGILERWKEVTKKLQKNGKISEVPRWDGRVWSEFRRLVEFRNGLVHANSSRPANSALPKDELPVPHPEELAQLPLGWAVGVVADLIRHVHATIKTDPPPWVG